MDVDLGAVVALVEEVAAEFVDLSFLDGDDLGVREKSPGELVTRVDLQVEAALTAGLDRLAPGVPVVGEEDPSLLPLLAGDGPVWLVDPLDGTGAFAAGSPDHAVMVALIERRQVVAAVVHQPAHARTFVAERGAGAWVHDVPGSGRLGRTERHAGHPLRGAVLRRFLPGPLLAAVDSSEHRFGDLTPSCTTAGVLYPQVADGELGFLLFWRTLPWDHAPGSLLVTESGGSVRRLDGGAHVPGDPGEGLLVCAAGVDHDEVLAGLGLSGLV